MRNVWQVSNDSTHLHRDGVPSWVFVDFIVAANIFWLQHWLYVSLYTKVSLMAPLTFCNQSETVKKKRLCYEKVHLMIDILIYAALVIIVVYEIADSEVKHW